MCAPATPLLTAWNPDRAARVLEAARREWASVVREPPGPGLARIRSYITGIRGPAGYAADGDYQWCGAFAAFCLMQAGARPELLEQKHPPELGGLGSTYRARCLANLDARRLVTSWRDLRAGDVGIVGRLGKRPHGEHVVVVADAAGHSGTFPTYEGNATGMLGDSSEGEGVVYRSRLVAPTPHVKGFMFGIRLLPEDWKEV